MAVGDELVVGLRPGQPVVGLDFDGVLNILVDPFGRLPAGFERHSVELDRANWPTHPYVRPLPMWPENVMHSVIVSREHGPMVRSWQDAGAAVVWATTWERAVLRNAHLSDIPDLPVLEISKVVTGEPPHRTADWKVAGLIQAFPGHPIAWVDDFGSEALRGEHVAGDPPSPLLVVAPDEAVGLTLAEANEVVEFIRRNLPAS